jgi:hypothetical protein
MAHRAGTAGGIRGARPAAGHAAAITIPIKTAVVETTARRVESLSILRCFYSDDLIGITVGLPAFSQRRFHFDNALLVSFIEGPLFDALPTDQAGLDEDAQVLARGWLADAQFLSDEQAAHAILHQVAVHLRRKMRTWVSCGNNMSARS